MSYGFINMDWPQGGIILTDEEDIYNQIEDNAIFNTMDNINLSRIASLSIAVEINDMIGAKALKFW